jgi:rubrerythrin
MLEIKTIMTESNNPEEFDKKVNDALREGWELVRRDVLPAQTENRYSMLYAELEREIEEEDPEVDTDTARWKLSRDPALPYRCDTCGGKSVEPSSLCPHCKRIMLVGD